MTTPARRLSFGIKTSQIGLSYADILASWRDADAIDVFEHAWLWDHMVPLRGETTAAALEAWTLLAALAAQTSRLRLGVMVTSNRLRLPTLLAKMAATVDIVSGGRLDFGIGAGGSNTAGENPAIREFAAYGVPLVSPARAVRDLDEALRVIRRMWAAAEPFDFDGPSIHLRGAICEPKPVQRQPPILIGGWGDRALRVVAEHADIWNFPWPSAQEFAARSSVLDRYCEEIGRSPGEVTRSVQLIVRADDPAEPAASRALLGELIAAGATHFVIAPVLGGRPLSWLVDNLVGPALAGA
ncbi:LLM class flavin-dependent oxidoreductase [Nakamurella lactea]|uniref:LLM class flavin-dependent oxidoreductase n=1 Tax=Nakamurella lactea TaxID=459515 RepID=UPI0004005B5A|nr:LLM class flavin-dependent oxidoreductase [Nakamurella lactea]